MRKTILSLCMAAAVCHGSIDATTAERGCVKNAFFGHILLLYIYRIYGPYSSPACRVSASIFAKPFFMKRLIFTFLAMLAFSIGISAQANNGIPQANVSHLKFQGIPITGSMKSFCQKLLQKGYKYESPNLSKTLTGKYMGRKVRLYVHHHEGTVYSVEVDFLLKTKSEADDLLQQLIGGLRLKYPRLQEDTEHSGWETDPSDDCVYAYVAQVPRGTRGQIDWKNMLGEFTINLHELVMGDYSYLLAFYYIDEYNNPEWKDARKQYLKDRKAKLAL